MAELVAVDLVRHEFCGRRFELRNIVAVLSERFGITSEASEQILDKACAVVIYGEASEQRVDRLDWFCVSALIEARSHLNVIDAARLIDIARTDVERERREGGRKT